jgi:MinD-like ATPase involved in chromosome partitioning or flagellar assembly
MAPTCVAFASPRGGSGKSTLSAQLSAAFAANNPNQRVLLVDCSVHGDSSSYLLGGVRAPDVFITGVRTQGQLIASQNPTKTTAAFFSSCLNARNASVLRKAWRATMAMPDSLEQYALKTSAFVPESPTNLYVLAGTPALLQEVTSANRTELAKAVLETLQLLGDNWLIFFDLDAELMERQASLVGLEVSQNVVVVLSAQFADWARVLDDPCNGLFTALKHLKSTTGQHGFISTVLFNKVAKTRNVEAPPFPFTGNNSAVQACAQIVGHAHDLTFSRDHGMSCFYNHVVVNQEAFAMGYVTAVHDMPENLMQRTSSSGIPIVSLATGHGVTADVLDASKAILNAVCAKMTAQFALRAYS